MQTYTHTLSDVFLSLSVNSILLEFSYSNQICALTKTSDTVSQLILCQCSEVHLILHSWLNPVLRMSPWFCFWMFSAAANRSSVSCYFARVSLLFYFVFMKWKHRNIWHAFCCTGCGQFLKKIRLKGISFVNTSVFVWILGSWQFVSIYLAHSVHSSLLISETWQV